MPAYLIVHPRDQRREDVLIEDDDLSLSFQAGWAVLTDSQGVCLAIPSGQGASIQRVEEAGELKPSDGAEQVK
ncbi:hypothetical protein [Streptomyces malaysiensis]